ncbi:MAG: hypothetical protein F2881_08285 [Actinobacteria bacterium]|uniref:Unannotated protein n=1 Tax=freshwater metagenome TaxID=449393 RepID=A0A6J7QNM4_9ZZZZ|nr:hypothetical protein [Actinomycetota bacterium]
MSAQTTVSTARTRAPRLLRSVGWPRMSPWQTAVVCVLAALLPLTLSSSFWLGSLTLALIWMVLNMSWNLVLGYSGIWNLGQLAIYAIGGYGAALASERFQLPAVVGLLLGGVAAMLVSLALAIPSLRLRGIYVSLLTFGFAEVVRLLIITDKSGITGGPFGISDFDGFGITSGGVPRARTLYWIALAAVIVTALVMYVLIRSPLGTGLMALRDNPALAAARGISPRRYQSVSFGISGFFAGLAGGLYAYTYGVISPTVMGLGPMTLLVTMMVVGGLGTQTGPIVGTLIIAVISTRLEPYPEFRLISLSVILLAIILLLPRGVVPVVGRLRSRLSSWVNAGTGGGTKKKRPPAKKKRPPAKAEPASAPDGG